MEKNASTTDVQCMTRPPNEFASVSELVLERSVDFVPVWTFQHFAHPVWYAVYLRRNSTIGPISPIVPMCRGGLVNHAHPAFTELVGDLVVTDGLADQDGDIVARPG